MTFINLYVYVHIIYLGFKTTPTFFFCTVEDTVDSRKRELVFKKFIQVCIFNDALKELFVKLLFIRQNYVFTCLFHYLNKY